MHHHYSDITDKLGEPTWWDENAVPRYCEFGPNRGANIYAAEIALLLIACQGCGQEFRVAMSTGSYELTMGQPKLSDLVTSGRVHYGDPPNARCCPAGPTMNSEPLRVIEFWDRRAESRVPELEGEIAQEAA